jgi:hypothetical protein
VHAAGTVVGGPASGAALAASGRRPNPRSSPIMVRRTIEG